MSIEQVAQLAITLFKETIKLGVCESDKIFIEECLHNMHDDFPFL